MNASILPSLKNLHALSVLARAGSFAEAARRLGVTRSAVSHRIADLERQLDVTLIRKTGRQGALTDEAEALLVAMGDAIERIESAVEPLRRRRHQIRLSTVGTLASHWLLPRLSDFQTRHPTIEISISTTRRVVDLQEEAFDCAIRHGLGHWDGVRSTLLFHETLAPVAAPQLPADLAAAPLIWARSRYRDWPQWWARTRRPGKPANSGLIVDTRAQALDAALAGAGIAMMDMAYLDGHIAGGRLRLLGKPVSLAEAYWFVSRPAPANERLVAALRAWLVDKAGQMNS